jgi:hypothetical protein
MQRKLLGNRALSASSFSKVARGANEPGLSPIPVRWKRAAAASAFWVASVVTIAGGFAAAAPAFAGTCSTKSSGSSNTLIWTGTTYTCAYVATSGNKKISPGGIGSWTSSTGTGYEKKANAQHETGGVTITNIYTNAANTNVGSSITYSAFSTGSGDRHWNACVLWYTPKGGSPASNQFQDNCKDDHSMPANLMYISDLTLTGPASIKAGQPAAFTATVTAPDGGGPAKGTVALFRQSKPTAKDPVSKDCSGKLISGTDSLVTYGQLTSNGTVTLTTPPNLPAGTYQVYASYTGMPTSSSGMPSYCMAPPQRGLTPAIQANSLTLTVN